MERKNAWKSYDEKNKKELELLCKEYREFLSKGKTERECVKQIIAQAESAGYRDLDVYLKSGEKLKCGDKVYSVCMDKTVAMFQIGKEPLENGMNILGAHIPVGYNSSCNTRCYRKERRKCNRCEYR